MSPRSFPREAPSDFPHHMNFRCSIYNDFHKHLSKGLNEITLVVFPWFEYELFKNYFRDISRDSIDSSSIKNLDKSIEANFKKCSKKFLRKLEDFLQSIFEQFFYQKFREFFKSCSRNSYIGLSKNFSACCFRSFFENFCGGYFRMFQIICGKSKDPLPIYFGVTKVLPRSHGFPSDFLNKFIKNSLICSSIFFSST